MKIGMDENRKHASIFAMVVLLVSGMVLTLNSPARAAESQLNFVLVAVTVAPEIDGVKPILILSGHGTFTSGAVIGSGLYTYADGATETPKTILSSGSWRATEVLRWIPTEGGATYGQVRPGTVDLLVDLVPKQGPVIRGATLRINCNVGLAGIENKDPDTGEILAEGYWLTIPATASFGPTSGVGQFVPKDPILGVTEITG